MGYHILCIDDNKDFLFNLKINLQTKYQVSIAHDLTSAKLILAQDAVDLVFLDVNLNEPENGVLYISQIKKIDPSVIVIMLSGDHNPKFIVDSIKEGASDYLYKPCPHEELIGVIERNLVKKKAADRSEALFEYCNEPTKNVQIIGKSHLVQDLLNKAQKVKGHSASILIEGESGTGKEVLARYIHSLEENPKRPFIAVNCAAIPHNLIESELFGHEKGSFTGAIKRKIGKFELAHGGDLFLDEVNSLSPDFQAKLLRVLQEKEFFRVGGNEAVKVNVRIISASNKDLCLEAFQNHFREDLLYRLMVIKLIVSPLRERKEDIELLVSHFMKKHASQGGRKKISPPVLEKLKMPPWTGNIRELENVIQSILIMSQGDEIEVSDLPDWMMNQDSGISPIFPEEKPLTYEQMDQSLKEFVHKQEQGFIRKVVKKSEGNITKAARSLKISRTTLYNRMGREMEN